MPIKRRKFLQGALLLPSFPWAAWGIFRTNETNRLKSFSRVRPGDAGWPGPEKWAQLKSEVNGNLQKLESPFSVCVNETACEKLFESLKNPYFIGDNPALTQTSGWLNAWSSKPSVYAVAAKSVDDIVAAVNFARVNNLRLVVKGGGHSYQGGSNSADSLLIWTRAMDQVELHQGFVGRGCVGIHKPQPAVTIGAGAIWLQAYDAVITKTGKFIQGGGCLTVGVAGLILGGGFGSFSKHYGLAAAALVEAEIVTADGAVKKANACTNPDLFWALKGGGQGTFGVVSKLTIRTRELPKNFGAVFFTVQAKTDDDYKKLIARFIDFYKEQLFNPSWGEQVSFRANNVFTVNMLFHGLSQQQTAESWKSFTSWVSESPQSYSMLRPFNAIGIPAQHLWDPAFLKKYAPDNILSDDRPNAPESNIYWKSNRGEAGQYLYGYHSAWMPESLLEKNNQSKLVDGLFHSSRLWTVSLHFNKGLAGAPAEELEAAANTAINPQALTSFALAIIAGEGEPAFEGVKGHEPDKGEAERGAKKIQAAMNELMKVAPDAGSYISESNYFEKNWQQSFWGDHYARLKEIKQQYDPGGLFYVRHGVGSESWSNDGFTKVD